MVVCILHELSQVHCLKFERNYCFKNISDPFINIQIHGFSDASETAYGCCVYLRFLNLSGIIKTSLVTAKSRVSPVKKLSMPRLELLGALMLSRLIVEVNKHLSHVFVISELFTWTDSSVVYSWIMNDGKLYKVFVQNRLNEIRLNVGTKNWKLVNSKNNPVDIVSRGCRPIDLVLNTQWTHGPSFLTLSENEWPQLSVGDNFEEIINKEIKLKTSSACLLSTAINQKNDANLSDVIDVNRYNSFNKLVKVTALVYKFIHKLYKLTNEKKEDKKTEQEKIKNIKINKRQCTIEIHNQITIEDLDEAKLLWFREAQISVKTTKNFEHLKFALDVFVEEDTLLLRCRGRLGKAVIPYEAKYPILLCKEHYLSKLLIMDAHKKVGHNGVRETLNELRTFCYIPKVKQFIKKIIYQCSVCTKHEGKAYKYPQPPDLPASRLKPSTAFANVGIDYAGPIFVKNVYNIDNELFKAWICLITCQVSRAIYLDIATDYSSLSCINILRRFMSRRGTPAEILSDNGTSFTGFEVQNFAKKQ